MHTIYFRDLNGYWGPNSKEPNFWYINSISWVSLFNDVFEPTLDKQEVEFDSAAPQLVVFIWPFIAGSVLPFTTYSSSCISHLCGTIYPCLIRIHNNSAISVNFDNAAFFQNHDNSVNSEYSIYVTYVLLFLSLYLPDLLTTHYSCGNLNNSPPGAQIVRMGKLNKPFDQSFFIYT